MAHISDQARIHALAAQGMPGIPVTVLIFETNQAVRACNVDLAFDKLAKPLGPKPEDSRAARKFNVSRRERILGQANPT